MSNPYFEFKQFRLDQQECSMKVGTDGVLLGAWFPVGAGCSVLDIGTGTGLIALMAAQRGAGSVTAVEIDVAAAVQAERNALNSPWTGMVKVICADIARFESDCLFDRIVCNPPYFRNSLRCHDEGRSTARHGDALSYETLVECSVRLLADGGSLSVVLPYDGVEEFLKCAQTYGLYMIRRTDVVTVPGKNPKRTLLTLSNGYQPPVIDVLQMNDSDGKASSDYINLVREFYLKY